MNDVRLPAAAQEFVDATNGEDRAAMLAAFCADGVVEDFGRVFTGPDEIGAWSDRENIGTHNRIAVRGVRIAHQAAYADISVAGDGYNGTGTFEFRLASDGRIQRLVITG